jgi:hypothetical protein
VVATSLLFKETVLGRTKTVSPHLDTGRNPSDIAHTAAGILEAEFHQDPLAALFPYPALQTVGTVLSLHAGTRAPDWSEAWGAHLRRYCYGTEARAHLSVVVHVCSAH